MPGCGGRLFQPLAGAYISELITQRSLVQIQPPQPITHRKHEAYTGAGNCSPVLFCRMSAFCPCFPSKGMFPPLRLVVGTVHGPPETPETSMTVPFHGLLVSPEIKAWCVTSLTLSIRRDYRPVSSALECVRARRARGNFARRRRS